MIITSASAEITVGGDLMLDLRPQQDVFLHYRPWSQGLAIRRWTRQGWVDTAHDPGIPLLTFAAHTDLPSDSPIRHFLSSVPEHIRSKITPFYHNQTTLLRWTGTYRTATDLLHSNALLLWLLAHVAQSHCWRPDEIETALLLRRKSLLERIVGPAAMPSIRFLRKITLDRGDVRELMLIRQALRNNRLVSQVRHLQVIPVSLLRIVDRVPFVLSTQLIDDFANTSHKDIARTFERARRIEYTWGRALHLGQALGFSDAQAALARCRSVEEVQRLRDQWMKRQNPGPRGEDSDFPPPPIPGNSHIRPIRSKTQLIEEGHVMKHCVARYVDKVLSGQSYIYRVLKPQRATLELVLRDSGIAIGECRMKGNVRPSGETCTYVSRWLLAHSMKNYRNG